ncbi:sigma-70 family RNA polymerase sigma factor [Paenibacillus shenyangensis]|uniref:sigma-70 family RNA polymerase sigma factor n=1 Tax=Paenibacillus sp. A9 TaxID=1284352 RepID=UPI000476B42B|nr:sigma-70 family RNA polymerase sigma factor [Paenibacillus sp. A9]
MVSKYLDQLYRQYTHDIYRYLYSLSRNHHTAEDLMQETFYRAYLYLEVYNGEKVKPWLFRAAYHAFIDDQRKRKRQQVQEPAFFDQITDSQTSPDNQLIEQEQIHLVITQLDQLPIMQKQAVLLYDFHQFSYQESSEIMDISLAYFKVLLFRGRQRIRDFNQGGEYDE